MDVLEFGGEWAAVLVLVAVGIPLIRSDLRVHRLPNALTTLLFGCLTAVIIGSWIIDPSGYPPSGIARALLGALAFVAVTLLIHLISPAALGLGDVKLGASLGLVLAWFSWNALLAGMLTGFILAGLGAAVLLLTRKVSRKGEIAMGPYLIAGTLLTMLASLIG